MSPRFSVISAVYDVGRYLPDFIASIDAQTLPADQFEIIAVDDGSTDDSLAILQAWQQRRPDLVRVLTKENGGQSSARNLGLQHARGEWVTFPDPDDMLEANALSEVAEFLGKHPETEMVAIDRSLYLEETKRVTRHPLYRHFAARNLLRDLDEHPEFFHGSAPCAFFRRSVLEQHRLLFHDQIKPNFEDGFFCNQYLLRVPAPRVGFLSSTKYLYRKRADSSSTLNRSRLHVGRFTSVPEHGYLAILEEAKRLRGTVPEWLQTHVLYELWYYFNDEEAQFGRQTVAVGEVAAEFHRLLARITDLLDRRVVETFTLRRYQPIGRDILLHGYRDEPWHTPFVVVDRYDTAQQTVRLTYRFTHELPDEHFSLYGVPVKPLHAKICAPVYFDRSPVKERIVWLPAGTIRVELDGENVEVRTEEPAPPNLAIGTGRLRKALDPRVRAADRRRLALEARRPLAEQAVTRLARTRPVRRLFGRAWVLMDRIHDSDDSGEHLFRHLRAKEPKINAWFVVERGTPDYRRLRKQGYRRVVPHGGLAWKLLMLNCTQLISSHADLAVSRPPAILKYGEPKWRFTFLQHGVIKDDLSRWLNPKNLDIFVVSTHGEYHSVIDDDTAYRYTTREVQLTGLPRFDKVLEAGQKFPPDRRDLILVTPTWRTWLVGRKENDSQRWSIDPDEFRRSEFAQNWLGLIASDELRELARRSGLTIGVLMHPNLQSVAPALDLPPEITTFGFTGTDVRELFARARVVVTDYSSMAFNAAYIERPVVYFQFDRERMFSGGHVGRGGYFKYERDGYGPVTGTPAEALAAVIDAVEYGPAPRPEYLSRIEAAFPARDGRCCERVVDAIRAGSRKVARKAAALAADEQAAAAELDEQREFDQEVSASEDDETIEPGADINKDEPRPSNP